MKRLFMVFLMCLFVFPGICLPFASSTFAEDYPDQNIRWIVPSKPGGGFDTYSRAVARSMEKFLPKDLQVIIENRPGAGQQIGVSMLYNSKPDGYTIGIIAMPGMYVTQMFHKANYDMAKMTWLGTIQTDPRCIVLSPKSKFRSLKDLQQAESVQFSIVGYTSEAEAIIVNHELKINAQYISGHKVSKEAILAVLRGDAEATNFSYGSLRKYILKKELIPVLVAGSKKRIPEIQDVPTLAEVGYPELNETMGLWRVIGAPPGMPEDRERYLRDIIWRTLNDGEFLEWSKKSKRTVDPLDGDATGKALQKLIADYTSYKHVFKQFMK